MSDLFSWICCWPLTPLSCDLALVSCDLNGCWTSCSQTLRLCSASILDTSDSWSTCWATAIWAAAGVVFLHIAWTLVPESYLMPCFWHQLYKLPSFKRSQSERWRVALWRCDVTSWPTARLANGGLRPELEAPLVDRKVWAVHSWSPGPCHWLIGILGWVSFCPCVWLSSLITWFPPTVPDDLELLPLYSRYLECLSSNSR